jgi:cold-inducible RNA-binding protein
MKIYLGNLPKTMTDPQLNDLVVPFGKADTASVAKDRATGESKGFGFVEFGSAAEANAAIKGLDGKEVEGRVLKVNEAHPPKERAGGPQR